MGGARAQTRRRGNYGNKGLTGREVNITRKSLCTALQGSYDADANPLKYKRIEFVHGVGFWGGSEEKAKGVHKLAGIKTEKFVHGILEVLAIY